MCSSSDRGILKLVIEVVRKEFQKLEATLFVGEADFHRNLRIFEELLHFARKLGKFPPKNPLEGIEYDIKYAKVINAVGEIVEEDR